jgi:cytidylate kinase
MAASRVSALPEVRAALLGLQRRLGCVGKSILEGRDIGTIVFPDADVKFFLTADVDERAKRRLIELEAAGADAPSFAELRRQIVERDHGDSARSVAPLKKAEDAIELDTSHMTLDEVVAEMESIVRARLAQGGQTGRKRDDNG